MCTQLYAPMEIEKQIAFDKNNLASFRKKWATPLWAPGYSHTMPLRKKKFNLNN